MDLNLEPLKREILAYLDASEFAVFHSSPGGLDSLPMVLWDSERYPDYRMFLEVARKAGVKIVLFASCELEAADLRVHEGVTCSIELAFDFNSRIYIYELQPDWYDDFVNLEEEIMAHVPDSEEDEDGSLGGYYSKN